MKILFTDRVGAHSIWSLIDNISRELIKRNHEVIYVRFTDGKQIKALPIPTGVTGYDIRVPACKVIGVRDVVQSFYFSKNFIHLLHKHRPDIVHTNFAVPGIVARILAFTNKVPVIVSTQHELYDSMRWHLRWGVRFTERFVNAIVYVSKTVAKNFLTKHPSAVDSKDGVTEGANLLHNVITNGINLTEITRVLDAGLQRDPKKIVCVGRMVPVKGQAVLLKAMPIILSKCPGIHLKLIGSGPQESELQRICAELEINQQVDFLGWLSPEATLREIATAGIIVVPSDGEGYGLVVAEAMALETPIVASRIEAFGELLGEDDGCAWFFERGDLRGLANAVCRVLAEPTEAAACAASARKRVHDRFSVEHMVRDYLRLYDALVSRKSGQTRE